MRYLALAVGIPALIASCWLVRREGEAYRRDYASEVRDGLADRLVSGQRPEADPSAGTMAGGSDVGGGRAASERDRREPAADIASTALPSVGGPGPLDKVDPRAVVGGMATGIEAASGPLEVARGESSEISVGPPSNPTPSPAPGAATPPAARFEPRNPGEAAIADHPGGILGFDLSKPAGLLGAEERRALGRAVHARVVETLPVFRGGPLQERVTRLAGPLEAHARSGGAPPEYFLIDSDDVFAFAHIGGYVYLSRGVFALAANDGELQFVLARERAHLERDHVSSAIDRDGGTAELEDAGLADRAFARLGEPYPRDEDRQADEWAYNALLGLKRSRRECLGFLMRLERFGESRGHGLDPGGSSAQGPPNFEAVYCDAPAVSERLKALLSRR